jgi:integrase
MNDYGFLSDLGDPMGEFLDFKRKMGHPYERGICYLKDFDRFCFFNFRNVTCLDEKMCLAWARRRPTESNSGFISRITPLRQLGKFLNSIGIQAYVLPESFHGHVSRYLPHIFTEQELQSFFASTDSLVPYYQSVARHFVAPVLFRLLYCCGLRPYEGRLLQNDDVDLRTGRTFIRQSKGHKDRIVMIEATENLVLYRNG